MSEDTVPKLILGLLLFASLMLLLFLFAHLREREQARSRRMRSGSALATGSGIANASNARDQRKLKGTPYARSIGEHYITGSNPPASPGAGKDRAAAHLTPPRLDSGSAESGLTITGFDSAGSKVYLKLSHAIIAERFWGVTVGRDGSLSDFEVRDQDNYVSRRHFRIRWNPDDKLYEIEDLASTSGTLLDAKPLDPFRASRVRAGSTIKIGRLELDVGKA
jgi:hypothetical protein